MKNFLFVPLILISSSKIFTQVSGNVNYQSQARSYNQTIDIDFNNTSEITLSVKGLANLKADNYVALFSITQVGKTASEVNDLLNNRITSVLNTFSGNTGIETYVDMVSFVPVYEFEAEKKIFSKKTYNEIPTGFELTTMD